MKYILLFFAVAAVIFGGLWGFNTMTSPGAPAPATQTGTQPTTGTPPATPTPPSGQVAGVKCYQYAEEISQEEFATQCLSSPYIDQVTKNGILSCNSKDGRVVYCRSGCSYDLLLIPPGGVKKDLPWPADICGFVEKVTDKNFKAGYVFKAYVPSFFTAAQKGLSPGAANALFFNHLTSDPAFQSCLAGRLGQAAVNTWLSGEIVYFPVTALTKEYNKIGSDLEVCYSAKYKK